MNEPYLLFRSNPVLQILLDFQPQTDESARASPLTPPSDTYFGIPCLLPPDERAGIWGGDQAAECRGDASVGRQQTLDTFSKREALEQPPKSNLFLRSLFTHVAGHDLDERIAWIIDDLALDRCCD